VLSLSVLLSSLKLLETFYLFVFKLIECLPQKLVLIFKPHKFIKSLVIFEFLPPLDLVLSVFLANAQHHRLLRLLAHVLHLFLLIFILSQFGLYLLELFLHHLDVQACKELRVERVLDHPNNLPYFVCVLVVLGFSQNVV
jgi:hypothetical protein